MVRLVADRYGQPVAAQDEDALVGGARCPGGIGREIGEQAVDIGAKARCITGPAMRCGQCVVGPALRQQPLAIPHTVLQVQHTELRVVAQDRKAGALEAINPGLIGGQGDRRSGLSDKLLARSASFTPCSAAPAE